MLYNDILLIYIQQSTIPPPLRLCTNKKQIKTESVSLKSKINKQQYSQLLHHLTATAPNKGKIPTDKKTDNDDINTKQERKSVESDNVNQKSTNNIDDDTSTDTDDDTINNKGNSVIINNEIDLPLPEIPELPSIQSSSTHVPTTQIPSTSISSTDEQMVAQILTNLRKSCTRTDETHHHENHKKTNKRNLDEMEKDEQHSFHKNETENSVTPSTPSTVVSQHSDGHNSPPSKRRKLNETKHHQTSTHNQMNNTNNNNTFDNMLNFNNLPDINNIGVSNNINNMNMVSNMVMSCPIQPQQQPVYMVPVAMNPSMYQFYNPSPNMNMNMNAIPTMTTLSGMPCMPIPMQTLPYAFVPIMPSMHANNINNINLNTNNNSNMMMNLNINNNNNNNNGQSDDLSQIKAFINSIAPNINPNKSTNIGNTSINPMNVTSSSAAKLPSGMDMNLMQTLSCMANNSNHNNRTNNNNKHPLVLPELPPLSFTNDNANNNNNSPSSNLNDDNHSQSTDHSISH